MNGISCVSSKSKIFSIKRCFRLVREPKKSAEERLTVHLLRHLVAVLLLCHSKAVLLILKFPCAWDFFLDCPFPCGVFFFLCNKTGQVQSQPRLKGFKPILALSLAEPISVSESI